MAGKFGLTLETPCALGGRPVSDEQNAGGGLVYAVPLWVSHCVVEIRLFPSQGPTFRSVLPAALRLIRQAL